MPKKTFSVYSMQIFDPIGIDNLFKINAATGFQTFILFRKITIISEDIVIKYRTKPINK